MSREHILNTIRKNKPLPVPLPEWKEGNKGGSPAQRKEVFLKALQEVGADFMEFRNLGETEIFLVKNFPGALNLDKPDVKAEYAQVREPAALDQVGTVVLTGLFGVAENGAIWLDGSCFPNRLLPFVAFHLIIRLNESSVVADMHEASRLVRHVEGGFGVFISGPSKTADIEQSLVYGAHGAKKLTVLLYT